jgi:pyruvyltransferase
MKKIRKLYRYYSNRLPSASALPFFWHVGRPNFGDDINPSFFRMASQQPVRLKIQRDQPHFLGMGSILDRATPASIVLGAGCLSALAPGSITPARVVSVRGELSRAGLVQSDNVLLGDPMVLLNIVAPQSVHHDGPIGFVPHVSCLRLARKMAPLGVKIIDPGLAPWKVIREIAGCSRIFSQSLHGLIVADALEIPNIWIAPSESVTGDTFKFKDYFSTLDTAKTPYSFDLKTFSNTPHTAFNVCNYKYDKKVYLDALRDAVATL